MDYRQAFNSLIGGYVAVEGKQPFNIIAITDHHAMVVGTTRKNLIGKALFTMFPEPTDYPNKVRDALLKLIETKKEICLDLLRYDIPDFNGQGIITRFWSCNYVPLVNDGKVTEIIITAIDITEAAKATELI